MMKRAAILIVMASALVAGCGGESHQDLRAWMSEQGKNSKGRLEPLPRAQQAEAIGDQLTSVGLLASSLLPSNGVANVLAAEAPIPVAG